MQIYLYSCATKFESKPQIASIGAPIPYVLATTDTLFGPEFGEPTVAHIRNVAGVEASSYLLTWPYRHRTLSVDRA